MIDHLFINISPGVAFFSIVFTNKRLSETARNEYKGHQIIDQSGQMAGEETTYTAYYFTKAFKDVACTLYV